MRAAFRAMKRRSVSEHPGAGASTVLLPAAWARAGVDQIPGRGWHEGDAGTGADQGAHEAVIGGAAGDMGMETAGGGEHVADG